MKKVTLLIVMLAFMANISMAQNKERVNAFNYSKNAQGYINTAEQFNKQKKAEKAKKQMDFAKIELTKAKTSIDLAAENEETKNDAKTWHYYGIVYYKIAAYPEFNDIDTAALEKSLGAFVQIAMLDMEYFKANYMDIYQHINSITTNYFNKGAVAYENGDYKKAMECYMTAYMSNSIIGKKDNEALLIATQIAIYNAKEYEAAIEICNQLLADQYESPKVYQYLAVANGQLDKNDEMLKYINEGRAKFPEDENLINEQINAYLKLKREAEIIDQIRQMAEKNTENSVYYFILGTIYGNQESELFNVDEAINCYNKVIEINPNDENAYINIAGIYIDKSNALKHEADELPLSETKKYDEMMVQIDEVRSQALPYVEKAHELLPEDEAIKQILKSLYVNLKMMDKAKALEGAQ